MGEVGIVTGLLVCVCVCVCVCLSVGVRVCLPPLRGCMHQNKICGVYACRNERVYSGFSVSYAV